MDFLERNDIFISPYRLRSRGFLNSLSNRREFIGTLIRIGEGYGCIHPWPELGDPPLEKCLDDLRGRRFWPIVRRALRCAEFDNAARSREESLFEELDIPRSHATLVNADARELAAAVEAGFDVVKMKTGRDLVTETAFFESMHATHPQLRWRFDFNEALNPTTADEFLLNLSPQARMAIDFIEDICPFSELVWEKLWERHRVRLAVDRESAPHRKCAQVMIIKPAVDEPFPLAEAAAMNGQALVFTSYMDHPLGQAFAAWEAARMGLMFPGITATCGLQTHHIFDKDVFTESLGAWNPEFTIPEGTGLGFDDALASLAWVKL